VKEELEHSRLRAEQEMRDHRLRSLELRAAAAVAAVRHGSGAGGGSSKSGGGGGSGGAHGQHRVARGRSQSPSAMHRSNSNSSSYRNGNRGDNVDGFRDDRYVDANQVPYYYRDEEDEYYNNGSDAQTTQSQMPAVAVSTTTSSTKEGAYFSSAVHDPHQRGVAEEVCTISQFMHLSFQCVLSLQNAKVPAFPCCFHLHDFYGVRRVFELCGA
jgi:hypothetical protein